MKQLKQRTHRLLVASIVILLSMFYIPFVNDRDWLVWLITFLALIPMFTLTFSLGAMFNGSRACLDERQRVVKLKYFQRSYWISLGVVAWVVIATQFLNIETKLLIATLVLTVVCLPAFVTAWLEPDPIQDDVPQGELA